MRISNVIVSGLFLGGFLLATAGADASDQFQTPALTDVIKGANRDCKVDPKRPITLEWDKASFAKPGGNAGFPTSACGAVFSHLEQTCSGPEDWTKPVQDQVKKVVCRYGGKGNTAVELASGVLTYTIDYEDSRVSRKIDEYVEGHVVTGSGESITLRRAWLAEQRYIADAVNAINKKCKIDTNKLVTFEYDRPSFNSENFSEHSPHHACAEIVNGVAYSCSDSAPERTAAVRSKINKVVCKNGGSGKSAIDLSGGVLTYSVDFDEKKPADKVSAFLKQKL